MRVLVYKRLCLVFILFCCSFLKASAQNCPPNIDFEFGDWTNWETFAGDVNVVGANNVITVTPSGPLAGRHTLITAATAPTLDPYGNFPVLCPNGSGTSVKLGNRSVNAQAERISYTFTVPATPNQYSIVYQYAVVFQDPGHLDNEQPRFTAKVFDVAANTYIPCASFEYISTSSLPGFLPGNVVRPQDTNVLYKPWVPVTINLGPYVGRQIRLEFTTADCTKGKHFGYAYIDVNTGCTSAITGNTYCAGAGSTTLTGPNGFQNYSWYNQNFTQLLGSQQTLNITNPVGNTTVALVIVPYNGFGCVDTIFTTLKENPLPLANAGPDTSVCFGSTVNIGSPPHLGYSYLWSPGNQATSTIGVSPIVPSTYIVTVTDDTSGCKNKDTVKVQPIKIDTSLKVTGGLVFCRGTNPNTVLSLNPGPTNIQWYQNGVAITGATGLSYTANTNGVYFAILKNGLCKDSTRKITVSFLQSPTLSFNFNSGNQCLVNNKFVFTNTSTSTDSLIYAWSFGDGGVSGTRNPTHTYAASGAYNVQLITTNTKGCKDTLIKAITVYPKPTTAFAASSNQCLANNSFTFTNTSNVLGGTLSYAWTFGDGGTSTSTSPTHSYLAAGNYTVKLITTSNNGCMDSLTKTVTVYPKPTTAFSASSNQCLANNSFTFTNTSNIVSGTLTYNWSFGDGGTSTAASPTHSYLAAGTYTVKLITTSNNGCTDSLTQSVTVYPKPTTAFAASSNQCLANNSFTFTNTSNVLGGTLTYNWTFGDGGTSTATSPTHSYLAAGT